MDLEAFGPRGRTAGAVQWLQRHPIATELKEKAMHHPTTHRTTRTTHRSQRPSLSPYVLDDTALDAVGHPSGTGRGRGRSRR